MGTWWYVKLNLCCIYFQSIFPGNFLTRRRWHNDGCSRSMMLILLPATRDPTKLFYNEIVCHQKVKGRAQDAFSFSRWMMMGSISIEHKVGVTILDYWFDRQESFYTSQRLSSLRHLSIITTKESKFNVINQILILACHRHNQCHTKRITVQVFPVDVKTLWEGFILSILPIH